MFKWLKSIIEMMHKRSGGDKVSGVKLPEWQPYSKERFSKGAKEFATLYKSSPKRRQELEVSSSNHERTVNRKQMGNR